MGKRFNLQELKSQRALTVQQAAYYASTSRDIVLRWLNSGMLGYYILPKTSTKKIQRRILREELDQFLETQYIKTQPLQSSAIRGNNIHKKLKLELLPREK